VAEHLPSKHEAEFKLQYCPKKPKNWETGGVAQLVVDHLSSMCKDLSSNPSTAKKIFNDMGWLYIAHAGLEPAMQHRLASNLRSSSLRLLKIVNVGRHGGTLLKSQHSGC
jgi:hypothetical protein